MKGKPRSMPSFEHEPWIPWDSRANASLFLMGSQFTKVSHPSGAKEFSVVNLTPRRRSQKCRTESLLESLFGHIDTIFVYSVDQMMSGGANLMIEVMRRALGDLGELLKGRNQMVPRILYMQFDNCGENKNKYMMAWCSMLVESKRYLLMILTDHWY